MKLKKFHGYIILRDIIRDKSGRPAIVLRYIGQEALVITGTTKINEKAPTILIIENKNFNKSIKTNFYGNAITKIDTDSIKGQWINLSTGKQIVLSKTQQNQLTDNLCYTLIKEHPILERQKWKQKCQYKNHEIKVLKEKNKRLELELKKLKKKEKLPADDFAPSI